MWVGVAVRLKLEAYFVGIPKDTESLLVVTLCVVSAPSNKSAVKKPFFFFKTDRHIK